MRRQFHKKKNGINLDLNREVKERAFASITLKEKNMM